MFLFFLLSSFLFQISNASGSIELILTAQQNSYIMTEICAETRCINIGKNNKRIELNANFPHRMFEGRFISKPQVYFDLHFIIFNANGDLIGSAFTKQKHDNNWKTNVFETSDEFNITYSFRTVCSKNYFGSVCETFCKTHPDRHMDCSPTGQSKCMQGWTGEDCMTPICTNNCSKNGKCAAPGQCECNTGFKGNDCSECIPTSGCVYGGCVSNNQSFTCQCFPGYTGPLCENQINRQMPIDNDNIKLKHVRGRQSNIILDQNSIEVSNGIDIMVFVLFVICLIVVSGAIFVLLCKISIRNRRMNSGIEVEVEIGAKVNKSYEVYTIDTTPNCHHHSNICDPPPKYEVLQFQQDSNSLKC
ncbi:unnamed protein product [Caenorhabditis angaria]|uniref:Delta-like protein n=1 Tax=Caenorhabditis angaria TaxID=860376 RepID=A0A9P1IH77_9PELO|nr:unnamed protein product [Caenorhabditis angaria]